MKSKLVYIAVAVALAALTLLTWWSADNSSALKEKIQNGYGEKAHAAATAMREFLSGWDPVGRSVDEVTDIFGPPNDKGESSIMYVFDNGYNIWLTEFVVTDGKVKAVRHPAERP